MPPEQVPPADLIEVEQGRAASLFRPLLALTTEFAPQISHFTPACSAVQIVFCTRLIIVMAFIITSKISDLSVRISLLTRRSTGLAIAVAVTVVMSCHPSGRSTVSTPVKSPGGYELVWADEFEKDGRPDTANWGYEKGFVRNEELQWYQEENAYCRKGLLVIEARQETKANPLFQQGRSDWRRKRENIEFTSACLVTAGKKSWQYGRFECRARIDISKGMWPAWWTLGTSQRWPGNGEIDIMEYYRGKLLANIACLGKDRRAEWYSRTLKTDSLGGKAWADQFHVWRMDWTAKSISLYIDDQLLNQVNLDQLMNKDGSGFNPFKQPHYMLLNLAMGGMNGGDHTGTTFPQKFEVDYVRVYQQK